MDAQTGVIEFDRYAAEYGELLREPVRDWFAPQSAFFVERKLMLLRAFLRREGRDPAALAWLDVGCGQGDLLRLGGAEFSDAVGCDPSAGMMEYAAGLDVRLQDAPDRLPFESGSFDLLTAVCVLHHVAPGMRGALLREAARLLRPGGMLAIFEHNPLNPLTQWIVSRLPVDADAHLLRARTARRLLRAADLAPISTDYFLYFPARIYRRLARVESWLSRIPCGGQYAVFGRKSQQLTPGQASRTLASRTTPRPHRQSDYRQAS